MKKDSEEKKKHQFCTFRIAEHIFGINILDVKEINAESDFTPIFHAPPAVKGYVNIRGQIYLILDLRLILGFKSKELDKSSRLMLFKPNVGESFGVLVDQIGDVVKVRESEIEEDLKNIQNDSEILKKNGLNLEMGVCKLKDRLIVILNSRNLLKSIYQ